MLIGLALTPGILGISVSAGATACWILATGIWRDIGFWRDEFVWRD